MKMSQVLRATAVVALFQYTAHAFLFLTAQPHSVAEVAVVDAMASHHFGRGGSGRSYWDFYTGYGIMVIASGAIEALLLWSAARLANRAPDAARPFTWILLLGNVAHATIALRFFFPLPAVLDAVVIAGLTIALFAARPRQRPAALVG